MRIRQLNAPASWPGAMIAAGGAGMRALARAVLPGHAPAAGRPTSAWVRTQFHRTDDGAGGRLQTLRRGVKFWARCWWCAEALAVSNAAFRDGALDFIVENRPELALRPLRSYLRRGLGAARRAHAVRAHFDWLVQRFPLTVIDRLYDGEPLPLLPAGFAGLPGLGVSLTTACGLGREGELALHLEWQGARVMSLAFSVLDARFVLSGADPALPRGPRIVVGTLQGARGADAALRELSAAAQRLRPTALLILAVQGLCAAWRLEAPLGVAAGSHVYAAYGSRRRRVALDYDAAWRESGGVRDGRHYWSLPIAPALRPDAEVESRRRAQHRRRNALRESLCAAVAREGAAWVV